MKNLLMIGLLFIALLTSSCADEKTINGKTYQPYGWADYQDVKDENVTYKVNVGNVILSIIFSETLVVPVWLTGWQFYEPVRIKQQPVNSSVK
jgi:hypothetical protein